MATHLLPPSYLKQPCFRGEPGPWCCPCPRSVSRPPAGGSRVSKVVGRGAALGTDNAGTPKGGRGSPPPGWPLPHLRRPCPPRPTPLTVFTEERRPELSAFVAKDWQDPTNCAWRRENNDRTGSASRRASGFPSRQAGLSRNLGGAVFSVGVQYSLGPGMGASVKEGAGVL